MVKQSPRAGWWVMKLSDTKNKCPHNTGYYVKGKAHVEAYYTKDGEPNGSHVSDHPHWNDTRYCLACHRKMPLKIKRTTDKQEGK